MLRIWVDASQGERRIVLEGELIEQWLSVLHSVWVAERNAGHASKCLVDLNEVTRIDESGERLLRQMKQEGANLFATCVFMKHLIKGLKKNPNAK